MAAFTAAIAIIYTRRLTGSLHYTVQPFYVMLSNNIINSVWGFTLPSDKITIFGSELYLWTLLITVVCIMF